MHRLHVLDACDAPSLAPAQECARRLPVGRAGVFVADVPGKEFQEGPRGPLPGPGYQGSQRRFGETGHNSSSHA